MESEEAYTPEYELEAITFELPNSSSCQITLYVWTVMPPPLEYMSTLHDNKVEISGRKLWCGSILLAQYLLSTHFDTPYFQNQRILELGSGSGLVGMTLAFACNRYLPSCIVLTDGESASVQLMKQNLQQEENTQLIGTNASSYIHTTRLEWGNSNQSQTHFEHECLLQFPKFFEQEKEVQFDCILAGDVLYKQQLPPLFFQTVSQYLSKAGGALYLCHVPRANVTHEIVVQVAQSHGFQIETLDLTDIPIPSACPLDDAQRVCLYRMTLV